jgi:hypothetical protein
MAMNRAQFKKELQEGLNTVFGLEYRRKKETWRQYLDVETENRKAYVEDQMLAGLAVAPVKAEGTPIVYDSTSELYTARYIFDTIALAFSITEEAEEDNLYGSLGARLSRALARSMTQTKAVRCANILNNGFDTNFKGGDGQPLFSTSHVGGGAQAANKLATPADLSETSLEDMLNLISDATDHRGIPIDMSAMRLVVPTALQFVAFRILHSQLRVDTANNDANALREMGMVSGGHVVDRNLTDSDAWFIKTDCPDGLKHIVRKAIAKGVEGDFETGNMRYKARERYVSGWSDWHGAYGSEGGGS